MLTWSVAEVQMDGVEYEITTPDQCKKMGKWVG